MASEAKSSMPKQLDNIMDCHMTARKSQTSHASTPGFFNGTLIRANSICIIRSTHGLCWANICLQKMTRYLGFDKHQLMSQTKNLRKLFFIRPCCHYLKWKKPQSTKVIGAICQWVCGQKKILNMVNILIWLSCGKCAARANEEQLS
jgi:hypothetical protein